MKKILASLLGVLIAIPLVVTGCSKKTLVEFTSLESTAASAEEIKTNVVKIVNKTKQGEIYGTGFFTKEGALVTASNIVDEKGDITVIYADNKKTTAKLVSNDIDTNIAVLSVKDNPKVKALEMAKDLPTEQETLYVIGYAKDSDEPEVKELTCVKSEEKDNVKTFTSVAIKDKAFLGAPVVNAKGQVVGADMLDNDAIDTSVMIAADTLNQVVKDEITVQQTMKAPTQTRQNIYTKICEEKFGLDNVDFYGFSDNVFGSVTDKNKVKYNVNQSNGSLIRLTYNAKKATADTLFGSKDLSVATATTDQGTYTYNLNRITVKQGEEGYILINFKGLKGTLNKIEISNVFSTEMETLSIGVEVGVDPMVQKIAQSKALYMQFLQNNAGNLAYVELSGSGGKLEEIPGTPPRFRYTGGNRIYKPVLFYDFNGDGIDEMIYAAYATQQYITEQGDPIGQGDTMVAAILVTCDGESIITLDSVDIDCYEMYGAHAPTSDSGGFILLEGDPHIYRLDSSGPASFPTYEIAQYTFDGVQLVLNNSGKCHIERPSGIIPDNNYQVLIKAISDKNIIAGYGEWNGPYDEEQGWGQRIIYDYSMTPWLTYEEAIAYLQN